MSRALCLLALLCLAGCSREAREAYWEARREKTISICYRGPAAGEIVAQIPRRGGGVVEIRSKEIPQCSTP